nr:alpha/beta hydrolase [Ramlibacter aurantiacus]
MERGAGAPVALLHGNGLTLADLLASGLVDRLAAKHRVIVFDRPGFGHSQRPRDRIWTPRAQAALLHRALVALGVTRPVVLGHSLGALVALQMAMDFPVSVAGLVLLGGCYYPTARADAVFSVPVALPLLGDALRYTVSPLAARLTLDRLVRVLFAPGEVPPGFLRSVPRELLLRPVQLRAAAEDAALGPLQALRLAPAYGELRLPVAVLAGAGDRMVDTDSQTRRLAAELRNSRLLVVPNAGHMLHHQALDAVVAQTEAVAKLGREPLVAARPWWVPRPRPGEPQVGLTASGSPPT